MRKMLTACGIVAAALFAINITVGVLDARRCLTGGR